MTCMMKIQYSPSSQFSACVCLDRCLYQKNIASSWWFNRPCVLWWTQGLRLMSWSFHIIYFHQNTLQYLSLLQQKGLITTTPGSCESLKKLIIVPFFIQRIYLLLIGLWVLMKRLFFVIFFFRLQTWNLVNILFPNPTNVQIPHIDDYQNVNLM